VAFKRDSDGQMQFQVDWPFFIFQKVSFRENKYLNYAILCFGLGVVLLTVLLWPFAAMARKHYGRPLDLNPAERRLRLVVRFVCILFLVFIVGWLTIISRAEDPASINALASWVIPFGIIGVLCVLGTLLACLNAFQSWTAPGRWIWTKLHDTALALACVGLVWFAITWKLMNFNPNF
jgi:hypothetical protein